jgi:hypothetical protein
MLGILHCLRRLGLPETRHILALNTVEPLITDTLINEHLQ